jgi:hypothetical protein
MSISSLDLNVYGCPYGIVFGFSGNGHLVSLSNVVKISNDLNIVKEDSRCFKYLYTMDYIFINYILKPYQNISKDFSKSCSRRRVLYSINF